MKARVNVRSVPTTAGAPAATAQVLSGAPASQAAANPERLKSWACLVIGEGVEILRGSEVICSGQVDDVSLNGNVLWVRCADPTERRLFVAADGVRVRRI